jgi:transcriptional regulator with XRE-family HTH domain
MYTSSPYTVSAQLLAREDFREACTERDFAKVFRLLRQWDGASQDKIASAIEGLSQSRVSRIMRGSDRIASLGVIERVADALQIPGTYFGLAPRPWEVLRDTHETEKTPQALAMAAVVPRTRPGRVETTAPEPHRPGAQPQEPPPQTRTVERPVGLRPHIERGFETDHVKIDFSGLSGETLAGVLQEPLDKVRSGRLSPRSITIRILVPDPTQPWQVPCLAGDLADSPPFRRRMEDITDRSLRSMRHTVQELSDLGLVASTSVQVRTYGMAPSFKMYIVNGEEVFFGLYPLTEHVVALEGEKITMVDLAGKDTVLFHQSSDGTAAGNAYVEQFQNWFESMWTTVSRERAL